jgi:hypothetical protein
MMILDFPLSIAVELVLAALLIPTLVCCVLVEKRLRNLRQDQASLGATVRALNASIAGAQTSLAELRQAAQDADRVLGGKVSAARLLADELSVLAASGERIATRMEAARETEWRAERVGAASKGALRAMR